MERRKESRLKANQSVLVTPMGLLGMPPVSGRVIDMSGSGLQLVVPNPLPCGSLVKVESAQTVIVGEVVRCLEKGRVYEAGVTLFHTKCPQTQC